MEQDEDDQRKANEMVSEVQQKIIRSKHQPQKSLLEKETEKLVREQAEEELEDTLSVSDSE